MCTHVCPWVAYWRMMARVLCFTVFSMMHCFIILHKGHFTCGMGSLWYRQQLEGESALKNRRGRIYSGGREKQIVVYFPGSGFRTYIRRANRFDAPAVTLHLLMKYGNYSHMKALLDTVGGKGIKNKYDFIQRYSLWLFLLFINIFLLFTWYKALCHQLIPEKMPRGKRPVIKNHIAFLPENALKRRSDGYGRKKRGGGL